MAIVAALAIAAAATAGWLWMLRHGATSFPRDHDRNILLITIDTLRADALGSYGGRAATPNLDRLAAGGLRFTSAHAQAVVTLPSHASILTGLYPFEHGIRDNAGYRLASGATTIATVLHQAGYATGAFVGAFPLDSRWGLNQGFDEYDDHYGGANRLGELRMPERRADRVVDAALRWIGQQRGRWFTWVHVYDPHAPYEPPPPFDQQYAGNEYAGEVAFTDHALGPLLDRIREGPRPTLVIVTGDHGESLGEHGELTHGLFAYESTLRIPLIIALTGRSHLPPASPVDLPARHVDIFPTILDALRTTAPNGLPGRSLLAAVERGETDGPPSYFESLTPMLTRGWAPLTGVVVNREKYIDLPIPELYDLGADGREAQNLLPARGDRGRALASLLHDVATLPATAAGARVKETGETRQRLQALGYVSGSERTKTRYTEDDDPKRLVSLDAMMQNAVTLFHHGRLRESLAIYEELMRRRPTMSASYLHGAYIQWELAQPEAAIATLRQALASGADAPDITIQLGTYLAETGSPAEAVSLLTPLAREESPDPDGLNPLGIALDRLGRSAEALAVFDRVIQLDPNNAMAYQNKGTVYLQQGNVAAAREALKNALDLNPDLPGALNALGVLEIKTGNAQAGIAAWKRAVEIDPRQYDTLFNLGVTLLDRGDRADARRYLEQFAQTAPAALYAKDIERVRATLRRLN